MQDDCILKHLFSSLPSTPSTTAAPLLKLVVDASASLHRRTVALGLPRGGPSSGYGHRTQPGSQWARSGVLDAVGIWISKTLKSSTDRSAGFQSERSQNEGFQGEGFQNEKYQNEGEKISNFTPSMSSEGFYLGIESEDTIRLLYSVISQLAEVS